jgi:uncharacterized sulfatase
MNRRVFLGSLGYFATSLPMFAGEAARPTPNVVMIVGDDMGWPDFGFMGHRVIQTPRLDRLAAASALFPNGYVPTSLCRASLATLLTGLYPHQHHICCNDPPKGVDRTQMHPFMRNAPAIPRLLREARYDSLQTGKFWEGSFANAGFTHGQTTNQDRHIAGMTPQIGRQTMQPIYDFIDNHLRTPFLVWYAPMMPHLPHTPPQRILQRYDVGGRPQNLARYMGMCEWFDETCGQLLDHLDKRKLTDNTLILFCIDNGWITPGEKEKGTGAFGGDRGKRTPYDGGIRTPVLVRWPGHTRAGRYNDLVLTIDFAPTILHACNVNVPKAMQGVNLLEPAAGRGRLKREAVFGEIYTHTSTNLKQPQLDVTHRWTRAGDWKLIVHVGGKQGPELFNLANDPNERTNLARKEPDRLREMQRLLERWVAAQ